MRTHERRSSENGINIQWGLCYVTNVKQKKTEKGMTRPPGFAKHYAKNAFLHYYSRARARSYTNAISSVGRDGRVSFLTGPIIRTAGEWGGGWG